MGAHLATAIAMAQKQVATEEGKLYLTVKELTGGIKKKRDFEAGTIKALLMTFAAGKIGDTIEVKGPIGEFAFNQNVGVRGQAPDPNKALTFTHVRSKEKQPFRKIGLIAGGSGITPVMQVTTDAAPTPCLGHTARSAPTFRSG